MHKQKLVLVLLAPLFLTLSFVVNAKTDAPAFDCDLAKTEIEQLICNSPTLAKLDRRLAPLYQKLIKQVDQGEAKLIKTEQRGWIKGRNDCWKATDKQACTTINYQQRITELQIASGSVEVPTPYHYTCQAEPAFTLTAYFYNDTEIPAAVFSRSTDQNNEPVLLGLLTPAASGAKYQAQNTSLWTHQKSALLEEFDQTPIQCDQLER